MSKKVQSHAVATVVIAANKESGEGTSATEFQEYLPSKHAVAYKRCNDKQDTETYPKSGVIKVMLESNQCYWFNRT